MFLLVIHVVLLPTQHLCFDMQKFYCLHHWRNVALLKFFSIVQSTRLKLVLLGGYRKTSHIIMNDMSND